MVAAENDRPEGAGESELGRRVLLRGMAAMGLAAVTLPLAACGSDDEPAAVSGTPEATPEATPEGTPEATPKPAAEKLVKDGNTPLAATADIPVNSGMLFEADEYIVTQPKSGDFRGFSSICTHEGCPVDVFDTPGEMDCSCHSSHFKITDGSVISGPAKKPLPRKPIIVEGGQIYKAKPA